MKLTWLAFHEDRACLLRHAVIIENGADAQGCAKPALEILVRDLQVGEFLPATAMDEDAIAEIQLTGTGFGRREQILPNHKCEAEKEYCFTAMPTQKFVD